MNAICLLSSSTLNPQKAISTYTTDSDLLIWLKFNSGDISGTSVTNYGYQGVGGNLGNATLNRSSASEAYPSLNTSIYKTGNASMYFAGSYIYSSQSKGCWVSLPSFSTPSSSPTTNGFSVCTWFYLDSAVPYNSMSVGNQQGRLWEFCNGTNGVNTVLTQLFNNGVNNRISTYWADKGTNYDYSGSTINNNSWHLSIMTYTADGTYAIYIDDPTTAKLTSNVGSYPTSTTRTLNYIGKSSFSSIDPYLTGYMDDFRYYNRVLTQAERLQIWNGGNGNNSS